MNFENSNEAAHQKWWLELDHYAENWYLDRQHSYYMLPSSLNEIVIEKMEALSINQLVY